MDNKKNGIPKLRFPGFTGAWEQRKLGEVVNFLDTLRKPLEGAKRVKGPYPYYGASGIVDYVDGYLFDEELILLSEDGANITERNYPVCFLASGKYWVNNHAHVLKIKEDNDNNFICNSLERKDYTKYNTGMAMPKLNKETCKGIPIMCPNYDEQKKIGNYFRKFDTLIALHQRKLEHLQEQKKGLLQKMFPKNGETVPEVRFPGFTDAWEQRKLGEVADVIDPHPSHRAPAEVKIGIPFIGISDVNEIGEINYSTVRVVDEDIYEEHHRRYDLSIPSLGIGRVASLGKVIRLRNDIGKYAISPTMSVLQPDTRIEINYLYSYMNSSQFQKQFSAKSNGSTRQSVGIKDLRTLVVSVPSSSNEQQKIGEYFSKFDSLIALHQRKLDHLELMKKGLLQQMFV